MGPVDRIANICTGHRAASWRPIQNLPGLFGSRAEAGTSHETDMTERSSPGGQGSKSAAQMAPRRGCLHGVGGIAGTTDPRTCSSVTTTLAIFHPFIGLSRTLKLEPSPQDVRPGRGSSMTGTLIRMRVDTEGRKHRAVGQPNGICESLCVYTFLHNPSCPSI